MFNSKLPEPIQKTPVDEMGHNNQPNALKNFAVGKGTELFARTALGIKFFTITRWLWIANWGTLVAWIALVILGITGVIQGEGFLSFVVFVLAALVFGVWLLLRFIRRFIERQTSRAFQRFERMVKRRNTR